SMMGVGFADVFHGALDIIGCSFYRMVPTGEPNHYYPPAFRVGEPKVAMLSKKFTKHVLLTGEHDMNHDPTKAMAEAYQQDHFEHVTFIDVPGMRHEPPNAEWFEKAIAALDETLAAPALAAHTSAGSKGSSRETAGKEPSTHPVEVAPAIAARGSDPHGGVAGGSAAPGTPAQAAADAGSSEQQAQRLLRMAQLYAKNQRYDDARSRLRTVIDTYPATPAAKDARKLMDEIAG